MIGFRYLDGVINQLRGHDILYETIHLWNIIIFGKHRIILVEAHML